MAVCSFSTTTSLALAMAPNGFTTLSLKSVYRSPRGIAEISANVSSRVGFIRHVFPFYLRFLPGNRPHHTKWSRSVPPTKSACETLLTKFCVSKSARFPAGLRAAIPNQFRFGTR